MSATPALVRLAVPAPGSKSAVPLNEPVTYRLPLPSFTIAVEVKILAIK
jgi:hypothetical protein